MMMAGFQSKRHKVNDGQKEEKVQMIFHAGESCTVVRMKQVQKESLPAGKSPLACQPPEVQA